MVYLCMAKKDKTLLIHLDKETKEKLLFLSEKNDRSMSSYIIVLIKQAHEKEIKA